MQSLFKYFLIWPFLKKKSKLFVGDYISFFFFLQQANSYSVYSPEVASTQ